MPALSPPQHAAGCCLPAPCQASVSEHDPHAHTCGLSRYPSGGWLELHVPCAACCGSSRMGAHGADCIDGSPPWMRGPCTELDAAWQAFVRQLHASGLFDAMRSYLTDRHRDDAPADGTLTLDRLGAGRVQLRLTAQVGSACTEVLVPGEWLDLNQAWAAWRRACVFLSAHDEDRSP